MHETPEDIDALAQLLDRSYAAAGAHLRSITTPERRVGAQDLVAQLTGMCLLVVAPVEVGGGLRDTLLEVYVPRYGPEWEQFLDSGPVYMRIDADRMFTFQMRDHG